MTVTAKAAADVTQTYATFQAGDLLGVERAGVFGKMTWAQFQGNDMTLTGTIDLSGATVTWDGGPLDVLAGTSITGVSGADVTVITGTPGTDGNLVQWNADGDTVDGPDVLDEDDMASDSASAVPTQQSVKAYVDASGFGVGQTWQSPSRAANTSYQNTTGKPIAVFIRTASNANLAVQVSTDESTWIEVGRVQNNSFDVQSASFIVPNNHYYRVNGATTITTWSELR